MANGHGDGPLPRATFSAALVGHGRVDAAGGAQAAEFIGLLKARPECFGNSRFILGNPWKNEPYGYCCSDGRRAFLAINNGVLRDTTVELGLGPAFRIARGQTLGLVSSLSKSGATAAGRRGFASSARLTLRAMEIVLLEAVPQGEAPTLDRKFDVQKCRPPLPSQPGRDASRTRSGKPAGGGMDSARPCGETLPSERRSTGDKDGWPVGDKLELKQGAHPFYIHHRDGKLKFSGTFNAKPAAFLPVAGNGWYQAAWQAWRLAVPPSAKPQPFDFQVHSDLPADVEYRISAHFVPQ